MTEDEKFEELAYDRWRQDRIRNMRSGFDKRIADGEGIDPAPFFALLMAEL